MPPSTRCSKHSQQWEEAAHFSGCRSAPGLSSVSASSAASTLRASTTPSSLQRQAQVWNRQEHQSWAQACRCCQEHCCIAARMLHSRGFLFPVLCCSCAPHLFLFSTSMDATYSASPTTRSCPRCAANCCCCRCSRSRCCASWCAVNCSQTQRWMAGVQRLDGGQQVPAGAAMQRQQSSSKQCVARLQQPTAADSQRVRWPVHLHVRCPRNTLPHLGGCWFGRLLLCSCSQCRLLLCCQPLRLCLLAGSLLTLALLQGAGTRATFAAGEGRNATKSMPRDGVPPAPPFSHHVSPWGWHVHPSSRPPASPVQKNKTHLVV